MKKIAFVILIAAFALAVGVVQGGSIAKAAVDKTGNAITLTEVQDIEVYNEYKTNEAVIDTIYTDNMDGCLIYRFTLQEDGFIRLALSGSGLEKTVVRTGTNASMSSTPTSVSATVFRDQKMLYAVVPTLTWKAGSNILESSKIALDKGTYFIVIKTDPYSLVSTSSYTTTTYVRGKADFILYYQRVDSGETFRPSSVGKENKLTLETVHKGLLTVPNPKDYYWFELKDRSLLKFNFMYDSPKTAKFTLYGPNREELAAKTFSGNNKEQYLEKYLEPGTYYCSLESTTANDGGKTSLWINQAIYPLKLTLESRTANSYVSVSTIEPAADIRWIRGELKSFELTSSKWKSGKVITDTKMFGVNMTGYYTVRVTDEYGNMFMQSINVTGCDQKAPAKPTVKTYTAGTLDVSGSAEKNALVTVTVNGKAYTCTASSKGNYKCTVKTRLSKGDIIEVSAQDISGNISEIAEVIVK